MYYGEIGSDPVTWNDVDVEVVRHADVQCPVLSWTFSWRHHS
jgi:hypothetical protein